MTGRARLGLVALAVVIAVAALLIAKPGSSRHHRAGAAAGQAPGAAQSAGAAIPHIVVRGGKPVGGVRTITFREGERVRFEVSSDIVEEVHVHGYDLHEDAPRGAP